MDSHIERRLLDLNRSFYGRFAVPFAESRSASQVSLLRILARVPDGSHVLDVGCGDGRAARALAHLGRGASYLGIDISPSLIALAREQGQGSGPLAATFALADIADPTWPEALGCCEFSHVLALAVLHHIPGRDLRLRLVQQMASLLIPSGMLIISTWQFLSSERLRDKIVSWESIGLSPSQVEPGDYLLDWRKGGYGLRYCHLIDRTELGDLCQSANLSLRETDLADGGLNLYAIANR